MVGVTRRPVHGKCVVPDMLITKADKHKEVLFPVRWTVPFIIRVSELPIHKE